MTQQMEKFGSNITCVTDLKNKHRRRFIKNNSILINYQYVPYATIFQIEHIPVHLYYILDLSEHQ